MITQESKDYGPMTTRGQSYADRMNLRKYCAMFRCEWSSRFPIAHWAPLPLRLIVGYGFMEHGFAKLARGSDAFATILHAIGVPAPHFMAWSTILIEVLGGLAVLLGAFVALVAVPMAALLVVAVVTVHLPYGFSSI